MKDCFGLSYLHKFFSVPFLQMQVSGQGLLTAPCALHSRAHTCVRVQHAITHFNLYLPHTSSPYPFVTLCVGPLARDAAAAAAREQATAAGEDRPLTR